MGQFGFSLRELCVLGDSAVKKSAESTTAEAPRTQRTREEFNGAFSGTRDDSGQIILAQH